MTKKWTGNDPKYRNPPVNEVVCGIFFDPIKQFQAPFLGLFWERIKPQFATCEEVAPLVTTIERFDKSPKTPLHLEVQEIPPYPRVWFHNADKTRIIQVQRDSFLYNWRRIRSEDDYPSYKTVIKCFQDHLKGFLDFNAEMGFDPITHRQYELTYVNHIPQNEGWETLGNLGSLFPDFKWESERDRFLPHPETLNWRTSFVLPEKIGRLHVSIQTGFRRKDDQPTLILEMKVRGLGNSPSEENMMAWFDLAHSWIINGFADITDLNVQDKIWRRTQ